MVVKNKICKGSCGRLTKIWKNGRCLACHNKENPPKPIKKQSAQGRIKAGLDKITTQRLHTWFNLLWENEPHYSEISGIWLGSENSSMYWHHILPKSTFPQYAEDRDNIIRLSSDEHTQVEANPYFYEEVNIKREKFKQKHGI